MCARFARGGGEMRVRFVRAGGARVCRICTAAGLGGPAAAPQRAPASGTRRVQLVRGEGRGVSTWYEGGGGGGGGPWGALWGTPADIQNAIAVETSEGRVDERLDPVASPAEWVVGRGRGRLNLVARFCGSASRGTRSNRMSSSSHPNRHVKETRGDRWLGVNASRRQPAARALSRSSRLARAEGANFDTGSSRSTPTRG